MSALRWREVVRNEVWKARGYQITRRRTWAGGNVDGRGPYYQVHRTRDHADIGQAPNLKDAQAIAEADFAQRGRP